MLWMLLLTGRTYSPSEPEKETLWTEDFFREELALALLRLFEPKWEEPTSEPWEMLARFLWEEALLWLPLLCWLLLLRGRGLDEAAGERYGIEEGCKKRAN